MKPWPHVKPHETVKVGWRNIVHKTFMRPDGIEADYATIGKIGSAAPAIIALTTDNQVIVAEQFRPGPERIFLELPGGALEAGETEQQAVERELLEETGYKVGSITFLGNVYKDAYTNTVWHYYLARDCVDTGSQQLDDGEFVTTKLISIDELIDNAKSGMMSDTSAVLLAYEELQKIKSEEL